MSTVSSKFYDAIEKIDFTKLSVLDIESLSRTLVNIKMLDTGDSNKEMFSAISDIALNKGTIGNLM